MSIIKLIAQYDRDTEAYIADLERQLAEERRRSGELANLLASSLAASERKTFDLIMSGHFDKFTKKPKTVRDFDEACLDSFAAADDSQDRNDNTSQD